MKRAGFWVQRLTVFTASANEAAGSGLADTVEPIHHHRFESEEEGK